MKFEIVAAVTAELNHHEHGRIARTFTKGVIEPADSAVHALIEQLLVPAGLAVPSSDDAGSAVTPATTRASNKRKPKAVTAPIAVEA